VPDRPVRVRVRGERRRGLLGAVGRRGALVPALWLRRTPSAALLAGE
jgi:hypothetical protein